MMMLNPMVMSTFDYKEARERGHRMAAHQVATNPEARKRVESVLGEAFCRNEWPEAYNRKERLNIFRRVFKGW